MLEKIESYSGCLKPHATHFTMSWKTILDPVWSKHSIHVQDALLEEKRKFGDILAILPEEKDMFNAFTLCPYEKLKVIILGMDPYIHKNEAHGLAFSVDKGKMPPSLRNIFKEIHRCFGTMRTNTNLTDWAQQGVLLLNTALTVREGCSGSHTKIWRSFTHDIVKKLGETCSNCVFILWGKHAQEFEFLINGEQNLVLKHSHPSPLSRKPFVGNNHFILCNEYLRAHGKNEIMWL